MNEPNDAGCPICNHGPHRDGPCNSGGYGNQCPCRYHRSVQADAQRLGEAWELCTRAMNADIQRFATWLSRYFGKARP